MYFFFGHGTTSLIFKNHILYANKWKKYFSQTLCSISVRLHQSVAGTHSAGVVVDPLWPTRLMGLINWNTYRLSRQSLPAAVSLENFHWRKLNIFLSRSTISLPWT